MAISKIVYKETAQSSPVTWMDATTATAEASDILSPKTAMLANGIMTTGTGSASGGGVITQDQNGYLVLSPTSASNIIKGTFTGTTEGTVMNITLPYAGNGYPIMGFIYPTNGAWKDNDSIRTLAQKYIIVWTSFIKDDFSTTPDYTNATENNNAEVSLQYKTSDLDSTSVTYNMKHENRSYRNLDASQYTDTFFRFKNATTLSVYIASNSYGFKQGIEYSYYIVYSS